MESSCFGCCSLRAAVVTAAVFSVIESAIGLTWNVQLLMIFDLDDDEESSAPLGQLVKVYLLNDYDVAHGITLASTGLHVLWLIFVILALKGNASLINGLLTPYKLTTYIITFFDIGTTIYFSVRFQRAFVASSILFDHDTGEATETMTYLVLMVLYSRGILVWFLNVYFAHIVERREREIKQNNAALALYIITHLSRSMKRHDSREQFPPPPPAYFPSYLPPDIAGLAQDSLESSWSLNTDSLLDVQNCGNDTGFVNRMYPHVSIEQRESGHQNPATSCRILNRH